MTNKEAIEVLKVAKAEVEWEYPLDYQIAFNMAIKALEQGDILDKIRAEIAELQLIGYSTVDGKREIASRAVVQVIDKYRK